MFFREAWTRVDILGSRTAGADMSQLERCLRAPYSDFHGHELLEAEFKLSWRQIFSKDSFTMQTLDFPLTLAPCQVLAPGPFVPTAHLRLTRGFHPAVGVYLGEGA
jgi:hypothetical protein